MLGFSILNGFSVGCRTSAVLGQGLALEGFGDSWRRGLRKVLAGFGYWAVKVYNSGCMGLGS